MILDEYDATRLTFAVLRQVNDEDVSAVSPEIPKRSVVRHWCPGTDL
jgi:hypothetical protein